MTVYHPGDGVWVTHDRYEDDGLSGRATITRSEIEGFVEVQFEPVLVAVDRVCPRRYRKAAKS